jgi:hypothetical protein
LEAGVAAQARQGQRARERITQYFSLKQLIEKTARILEVGVEARDQRTR